MPRETALRRDRTGVARRAAVLALVVALLPLPAQSASWQDDVSALLAARARAVTRGDEAAFRSTMAGAPAEFVSRNVAWFRRVRAIGLASYELALEPDGFGDLAGALRRRPGGDEVHVVEVSQRTALRGYDDAPAVEDLFLTIVRRNGRWGVVGDEDLDDLGLESARNVWDFGPVDAVERGGVMVVYHRPDRAAARRILTDTLGAVSGIRGAWPYAWRAHVVVMVPSTARELTRIFQATFDLGPFVAFTSSSVEREPRWGLTGHRVFVQPDTFFAYTQRTRRTFLDHELLHHATRAASGPFVPSWLEEGVAQVYGERATRVRELPGRVRAGSFDERLPEDWEFVVAPASDIRTSYDESLSFTSFLDRRFGRLSAARLYRALGAVSADSVGTGRYHLDRSVRRLFDTSLAGLEQAWAASVRREFS